MWLTQNDLDIISGVDRHPYPSSEECPICREMRSAIEAFEKMVEERLLGDCVNESQKAEA